MKRAAVRHTTVPASPPPRTPRRPDPPRGRLPDRPAPRRVARITEGSDASLLDVVDSLLNKGVVLNADLILSLADVDLVYVRLSALLCAADRLMPPPSSE